MLYSHPARYFTYFQEVPTTIVEGLVIPMYGDGLPIGTIWIVSHTEKRQFDAEDVRVMSSLGAFVSAALRLSLSTETGFRRETGEEREVVWTEFVRRIAHGDSVALEALMDETKPLVFGKALRILSFRADAEEVAADVYAQVWRTAARYDPRRGAVLAWLLSRLALPDRSLYIVTLCAQCALGTCLARRCERSDAALRDAMASGKESTQQDTIVAWMNNVGLAFTFRPMISMSTAVPRRDQASCQTYALPTDDLRRRGALLTRWSRPTGFGGPDLRPLS